MKNGSSIGKNPDGVKTNGFKTDPFINPKTIVGRKETIEENGFRIVRLVFNNINREPILRSKTPISPDA